MQNEDIGVPSPAKRPRLDESGAPFYGQENAQLPTFASPFAPPPSASPLPPKPTAPKFQAVAMVADHSDKKVSIKGGRYVSNPKGYRMARASHGVVEGTWYWEARCEGPATAPKAGQPEPHWRLGWSTGYASIAAPVGYQQHSYGYRDVDGAKVTDGNRIEYGGSYGAGDVIGFLIHLPSPAPPNVPIPPPILGVFEPPPKVTLEPNEGSYIEFFKNGKSQGKAYAPIFKGKYYPAVSMYFEAAVTVNFGPTFECFPEGAPAFEPFSKVASYDLKNYEEALARYNQGRF